MKIKRPPQWDDWRCYRCNQWYPSSTKRTTHVTPSGIAVAVCPTCAKGEKQ